MKSEARNPKQIQMTKIQNPKRDCFAALAMTRVVIKIIFPLDFRLLLLRINPPAADKFHNLRFKKIPIFLYFPAKFCYNNTG